MPRNPPHRTAVFAQPARELNFQIDVLLRGLAVVAETPIPPIGALMNGSIPTIETRNHLRMYDYLPPSFDIGTHNRTGV